jgi:hsp70-interacting protein
MPSSTGSSSGGGGGGDPWAWLGLLKWTLAHSDGTRPSDESMAPMSQEDKEFLERVMKEGIIDENERMKVILQEFSNAMDYYRQSQSLEHERPTDADDSAEESKADGPEPPPISTDDLEDLLQELRDIVENIDWARAFVSIKGLDYLLGAITVDVSPSVEGTMNSEGIPQSIRNLCLGIVATLAQNNPPVQKELLEMGAIKTLSDLFMAMDMPVATRTKIMQALSAIVRNDDLTEGVFEHLPQAPGLMVQGLGTDPNANCESLRSKTLFFLRAFLTADSATSARATKFGDAIAMVADRPEYLEEGADQSIRESSIGLLRQLLKRNMAVRLLLDRKDRLVPLGVLRVSQLRALAGSLGDDVYSIEQEIEDWESFLILLARANPEDEGMDSAAT